MMWALTSYIDADPEARRWLDGVPDPWGMVVNPNYLRIDLPVTSWPLLDDFIPPQPVIDGLSNPCYANSPSPYLALIANPTGFVQTIVQDMQYAISNVNLACPNGDPHDPTTLRLSVQGRQQTGSPLRARGGPADGHRPLRPGRGGAAVDLRRRTQRQGHRRRGPQLRRAGQGRAEGGRSSC